MIAFEAAHASMRYWVFALFCVLCGCARLPDPLVGEDIEFELVARFGMLYGGEAGSGTLTWRHGGARDDMLLTTPLGQGLAEITRDAQAVSLVLADGRRFEGRDAEALTEEVLGFRLPLEGFADWVLGRESPASSRARIERDAEGRPRSLFQGGWRVDFLTYTSEMPGVSLPAQMRLFYPDVQDPGAAQGMKSVELRIAISEWRTRPAFARGGKSGQP